MKKVYFVCALVIILNNAINAQVSTIVNYDFNASTAYPVQPVSTASNIICSGSGSESFQTYAGQATGAGAFIPNGTAGQALAMTTSSGANTRYFYFELAGSDLSNYQSYKVYLQPERSATGAILLTVAYSTDGNTFTNFATTYPISTSFTDVLIDLSSVTAINNTPVLYIKLMVSGASGSGTFRIDNFQVQANKSGSQGGSPWQVNGNNVNFLGNVGIGNANPVNKLEISGSLKTTANLLAGNNFIIDGIAGTLKNNAWAGVANRLMQTDLNGNLMPLTPGTAGQVLFGDGTWGSMPVGATSWSLSGNNLISTATGDIGIGTNNPQYKVHIVGDLGVTSNLFVGGGVITTSTLNSTGKINAGDLDVTNNLNVTANSNFSGTAIFNNSISVQGNITTQNSLIFGPSNFGFKYFPAATPSDFPTLALAGPGGPLPHVPGACELPAVFNHDDPSFVDIETPGGFRSRAVTFYHPLLNASLSFYSAPWNGEGHIESQGVNDAGLAKTPLYINHFCNQDVHISTGNGGSKVYTGDYVEMRKHLQIGAIGAELADVNNNALDIFSNLGNGVVITTTNNSLQAIKVANSNGTSFVVDGDGYTDITSYKPSVTERAFVIRNGLLPPGDAQINFQVLQNGVVYARELNIWKQGTVFPDYVFNKGYNLKTIEELEKFIKENQHLPNIPSAKVIEKEGMNVGELQRLQMEKIEELTLYVIQLKKEIEGLKKSINK